MANYAVKKIHKNKRPGTYNFKDDADGAVPSGLTDISGVDCTATVIASLDGHRKVLELYDNHGVNYAEINTTFTGQTSGTVEIWHRTTDVTKRSYIALENEGDDYSVQLYFDDGNVYSWDGGVSHDHGDEANNIWYHYTIVFDCATDTFDLYQNGILLDAGIDFNFNATTINKITLRTHTDTGYYVYFDAIGFSWDPNYNVGDNIHWRHYKESTDSFEGDDVGTQGTSITWVDAVDTTASVEIVPEFNEHKKVIRQYYSSGAGGDDSSGHDFAAQAKTGWFECWIKVSDITVDNYISLEEIGVAIIIKLGIGNSVFEYEENGGVWVTVPDSPTPVNDIYYHIYIQWYDAANDNFDLYINNIQYLDGVQTLANMITGIDRVRLLGFSATEYMYIDAPTSSLDSDERGDNRILEYNDPYTREDITTEIVNAKYSNKLYEWRKCTIFTTELFEKDLYIFQVYDINSKLSFEGELKGKSQDGVLYRYPLRDKNWDALNDRITHTFTTDDIHDPADSATLLLTALPNVGQEDGDLILVEGDPKTTVYSPVLKRYPRYMFLRDIADIADSTIIITPEGKVYMDDDLASGTVLDVDTPADKELMLDDPRHRDILETINYFEIFGAINPDTGERFYKIIDNSGTDKPRKWRYINNEFRTQTDLDNYTAKLVARVVPVKIITINIQGVGIHNMGTTLDYKFVHYPINIPQGNYYIIEERVSFDTSEHIIVLSEGMVEESKYSAGFEKPQNYMDSFAGEIYETDINTILLEMWELGSTRSYFGMTTPQDQHVYSYFFCTDKVDTDRDITLTFSFYCDAAVTIDGLLDIFRYPSDGATAHTVVENDLNFDVTFGVGARFNDVVYTLDAADIVADTIFQIGYQNVDVTQVYVTQIQAQYYVKRSLS